MNNPYINSTQTVNKINNDGSTTTTTTTVKTTGALSAFDKGINEALKDFVPENFNAAGFLKGALIGGTVAYILTNEKAQQAVFSAIVKGSNLLQAGFEELKERFEDVKAEIESQK
ncbi:MULTISPECIES: YtxH domain-containing protein [unclassified Campylobacter]|uniref:YtxH domain-containing protein n=1 Tax=unclassified Campylobacter TaxID=2593542 RepID=UPI001473147F|nr:MULTISPECIES: YtxH domain-containing protein [unclassified Campylobacter]